MPISDAQSDSDRITVRLIELILSMPDEQKRSLLKQIETDPSGPLALGERENQRKAYVNAIDFIVKGNTFTGKSRDISANGMFIETPEQLRIGQTILLKIPFTDNKKTIRVPAEVVRTDAEGAGVAFLVSSDA